MSKHRLDFLPWSLVIVGCLTLGLAPFVPVPHIWEKITMLSTGTLSKPIDIFDFFFHGITWLALFAKTGEAIAIKLRTK